MLKFQPNHGSVVWCDFKGLILPEMIKKRPVVVIKKHKNNSKLVYVLPISNSIPKPLQDYHHQLDDIFCATYFNNKVHMIKTDMIYTVSLDRLHYVKLSDGRRVVPSITQEEFATIRQKLLKYLSNS